MHTPETHRKTYEVHCKNPDDPYSDQIVGYILQEFPHLTTGKQDSLLNLLTTAILASGQVRYGPMPEPESLVAIRQVIFDYTSNNEPIPFITGWGSEKPNGSGIDIAELFALRTLNALRERVTSYYLPGIQVNMRIEDVSAPHLFFDRMDKARQEALLYTSGLVGLVQVLDFDTWLHPIPESTLISEAAFNKAADSILPTMQAHLLEPSNKKQIDLLRELGFTNPLTDATIQYYMERYMHLYPSETTEQKQYRLARYFSAIVARKQLKLTGRSDKWRDHLELAFNPPAPGFPAGRKRIYYRTMPSAITSNHMAPWRSKGYLKVGQQVKASLTSFDNKELAFNENTITIDNSIITQDVVADYIITE